MVEQMLRSDAQRWTAESGYFDREAVAARAKLQPTDPRVLERYGRHPREHHNKEFRFRLMGDIRGKRILDVGCGDGGNAVVLARLGATVTGIDISSASIDVARERAAINGVSDRASFICAPLEYAMLDRADYDIAWGDAILHHVIPHLDSVVAGIMRWIRPGGMVIFSEPVNRAPWLRWLRLHMPLVPVSGTPDERPLEDAELQIIRERVPGMQARYFQILGRLNRVILPSHRLEEATTLQRLGVEGVARFDHAVIDAMPMARRLARTCVLYGRR